MKRSIFYIACFFLFLLQTRSAYSQRPYITVKATADRQEILIGQPIHLVLEATVPGSEPLVWPVLDSLHHFEWLEKGKVDTIARAGENYYRQFLTVTSFDSGAWSIPILSFVSGKYVFTTDSIRIQVGYNKFDPNQDYHDIKDIIDVPNPYAKWIPWVVAAVTLISLVLVVWLIRKKRLLGKKVSQEPVSKLTPYEEALRQLNELEKAGFAVEGGAKPFYTRLNDILRVYLYRQAGISSLAETNEELIGDIRRLPLGQEAIGQLTDTLRISDFVKFAKYQPGTSDNEHHYRVIRAAVQRLEEQKQIKT